MVERSRQERFDSFIQILIIVQALLVEYTWTTAPNVWFLVLFILGLSMWSMGELSGGASEYLVKTISFFFITSLMLLLFFVSAFPAPTPLVSIGLLTVIFVIGFPLASLCCSIGVAFYLGELRRESVLGLTVLTMMLSLSAFFGLYL